MIRLPSLIVASLAAAPFATAQTSVNFNPTVLETVWNTDFTQVVPSNGPPFNVAGGLFVFNTVTIPAGTTLRGVGSRPMLIVCNHIQVHGTIDMSGGNGDQVNTLGAANFQANGGVGGPAGGHGGAGSPGLVMQSLAGQTGGGVNNQAGRGGTGGILDFLATCGRASGGGGGSHTTMGDPHYKTPAGAGTSFIQRRGVGGLGCLGASGSATRTLVPGAPGGLGVADTFSDNDFFGVGFDVFAQQLVVGELSLHGGGGGGGGGNKSNDNLLLSPNWINDARGGGGGGGGGSLIIFSQNNIVVGASGKIVANGGHGGGGEQAGSNNQGGGGGGGAGGQLILFARGTIELHVKGETYANNDYDFVVSADGGVSTTGPYSGPYILTKYAPNGFLPLPGAQIDSSPTGGFGGMGTVQLMAFPGSNADGTNTRLDDSVVLIRNGVTLTGATKQRFLAWRGYRNAAGVFVDDFGVPTNIGSNEGDIRPSPALLPAF